MSGCVINQSILSSSTLYCTYYMNSKCNAMRVIVNACVSRPRRIVDASGVEGSSNKWRGNPSPGGKNTRELARRQKEKPLSRVLSSAFQRRRRKAGPPLNRESFYAKLSIQSKPLSNEIQYIFKIGAMTLRLNGHPALLIAFLNSRNLHFLSNSPSLINWRKVACSSDDGLSGKHCH